MIIDQLPNLASVQETDEIPVERGTTTYKATLQKLKDLFALGGQTQNVMSGTHSGTGINYSVFANDVCCSVEIIRESSGTAASDWVIVASSIPRRYRPLIDVTSYFEHSNGTALRMRVTSNGQILIYSPPAGQLGGCITYPI